MLCTTCDFAARAFRNRNPGHTARLAGAFFRGAASGAFCLYGANSMGYMVIRSAEGAVLSLLAGASIILAGFLLSL